MTTTTQVSAEQAFPETLQAQLLQAVTQTQAAFKVPGVIVSVSIPGQGLWERSLGVEDKATGLPMVRGMHTRIGSITKTFTVTALLMLADEKRVGLDDPISKYLDFVPNGNNITLRQLANMTSGLYSYTQDADWVAGLYQNPSRGYTVRELLDVGFRREPRFPPGTNINYSNSNTLLLGLVIEQVSGMKVEEFFAQRIFARLGLRNTVWPNDNSLPVPFAHGYTEQTPNQQEADATFHNPSWGGAAGQLVSSLDDLKIWARALGEGTLLSREMQRERLKWVPFGTPTFSYGLGIGLFNG
jgi:D-alanyl-D-alanine carboxypeptidase